MRKFAAHYLLTDSGLLIKNGIAVANNNGTFQFIDTMGELAETEQLIFHNGLLISAYEFIKEDNLTCSTGTENRLPLFYPVINQDHLSLKQVIDLARQLQDALPAMNIPGLLREIEKALLAKAFLKKNLPSLYLLSGLELKTLRFTDKTRLKKVI